MKSDDRVDGMEVEAVSRGRSEGQAGGYRVLGRYGDVLNAARGQGPRLVEPPLGTPAAVVDLWGARRTR